MMFKSARIILAVALAGLVVFPVCPAGAQGVPIAIADAKLVADGDPVYLYQKAVTYTEPDFFYVEEDTRNSGIRVQSPGHRLSAGMRANVEGTMVTNDHQERMIMATSALHDGDFTIRPFLLRGSSVGGGDWNVRGTSGQRGVTGSVGLNNIGIFAKVQGSYEQIDATTFLLDDGSGKKVKCSVPAGYVLFPDWRYVSATGVISMEDQGNGVYSPLVVAGGADALLAQPILELHVHCIRVADDDGSRQAHTTPAQFQQWVDFANTTYAPAAIHFLYNPATDFTDLNSTLINNMTGTGDPNWNQEKAAGNQYAAAYPNKIVFFTRWGPNADPAAVGGFSWTDYNFVALKGSADAWHCGHPHLEQVAHEVGHYMGLVHTFAFDPFATKTDAENYFINHGSDPNMFDGDGLSDTSPDPGIAPMECSTDATVTLNGVVFGLPRTNIMSYYNEAAEVTPQQINRARWFLGQRMAHGMAMPTNSGLANPIEAETMSIVQTVNASLFVQDMATWGSGNWSAGKQLFAVCSSGSSFSLLLPVPSAGTYRLDMYATYAPDYGKAQAWLGLVDAAKIGSPFDGYAPIVAPSGRVTLGTKYLLAGNNMITFTVTGKNPLSDGYLVGLDCFELIPQ
ncbi:MAG: M43 family zinc metalloprotease [Armatimonadetes bacterium]|nr:M43 family zinc metalloprotease [Armatimonadota bacterium]